MRSAISSIRLAGVGLILLAASSAFIFLGDLSRSSRPSLPFSDSFPQGRMSEWHAFGGSWRIFDGGIRNNSNERGAKLVTGNPSWADYSLDADVELLGQAGDAGVVVRSSDEELGVDSYSGYYVGLRTSNNMVVLGRASHGWMEFQVATLPGGIHAFHLYHLRVIAVGCRIAGIASDPATQNSVTVALSEQPCARSGRIGLRSYSSGGLWRNVQATRAAATDIDKVLQNVRVADSPEVLQTEAGFNSALDISSRPTLDPWNLSRIDEVSSGQSATLRSLRIVSGVDSPVVTVLGTVVLTSPEVYLQDSTGGVSVHGESDTSLKIGDEVEVEGKVTPHPFSASFDTPKIRFLWSGDPAPALSVTASQAATGQFDAMFIEVEGRTKSGVLKGQDSSILELEGAHQPFSAILFGTGKDSALGRLRPGSLVRIRGVCVTDPNYTRNLIPFTVLLRTADDVTLLAGPPWWSVGHLFELAWIATGLTFLGVVAYLRAERWRMRAVLEERTRLAREIHDTLAQSLSGIAFQLESSIQRAPADGVDQDHVELALQMARQSRKEAHVTIAALRSLSAEFSIAKILQQMLTAQLHGRNIRAITTTNGSLPRMSAEVETQIFRIAQEAVANILEHANATEITLEICSSDHGLSMTIADNGLGFDTSTAPDVDGGHFGITGMKERARNIGATLNVDSGQGGTTVSLVVPHAHLVNRFTSNFPRFLRSRVFNASIRELRQLLIRQFHASQN